MVRLGGVLLTGGASRRLGTDKARVVYDGETLAVRAARELTTLCAVVVEVGDGVSGCRSVREDPPGSGPLAALLRGVEELDETANGLLGGPVDAVMLLACDYPLVDRALLRFLVQSGARTRLPLFEGHPQYVCGVYSRATLDEAAARFEAGERGFRWLADFDPVPESEWRAVAPANALRDIDTAADAQALGIVVDP